MKPDSELVPFRDLTAGLFAGGMPVPADGFKLDQTLAVEPHLEDLESMDPKPSPPWLVAPVPRGAPHPQVLANPLASPGLHRTFARLPLTASAIRDFANRWGFLGHSLSLYDPTIRKQDIQHGESIAFWSSNIGTLRSLIALWDLVRNRDKESLRPFVRWQISRESRLVTILAFHSDGKLLPDVARQHARKQHATGAALIAYARSLGYQSAYLSLQTIALEDRTGRTTGVNADLFERWSELGTDEGETLEPMRYFICREVNRAMLGRVNPAVTPYVGEGKLWLFPDSLRTALYVLFALELSEQRPPRVCARPGCGKPFFPSDNRQKYCERRCTRLSAYYAKQARARQA